MRHRRGRGYCRKDEAELLSTTGQVLDFTLPAFAIILGAALFPIGLVRLQQVIDRTGNLMRRRYNRLFGSEPAAHRSVIRAKGRIRLDLPPN